MVSAYMIEKASTSSNITSEVVLIPLMKPQNTLICQIPGTRTLWGGRRWRCCYVCCHLPWALHWIGICCVWRLSQSLQLFVVSHPPFFEGICGVPGHIILVGEAVWSAEEIHLFIYLPARHQPKWTWLTCISVLANKVAFCDYQGLIIICFVNPFLLIRSTRFIHALQHTAFLCHLIFQTEDFLISLTQENVGFWSNFCFKNQNRYQPRNISQMKAAPNQAGASSIS